MLSKTLQYESYGTYSHAVIRVGKFFRSFNNLFLITVFYSPFLFIRLPLIIYRSSFQFCNKLNHSIYSLKDVSAASTLPLV